MTSASRQSCLRTRRPQPTVVAAGAGICLGFGGCRRSWCRRSGSQLGICLLLGLGLGPSSLAGPEGPGSVLVGCWFYGVGAVRTLTYSLTWTARILDFILTGTIGWINCLDGRNKEKRMVVVQLGAFPRVENAEVRSRISDSVYLESPGFKLRAMHGQVKLIQLF